MGRELECPDHAESIVADASIAPARALDTSGSTGQSSGCSAPASLMDTEPTKGSLACTVSRLQSPRPETVMYSSKLQITVTVVYLNGARIVLLRQSWCCDAMACQLITGVEHATGKSGKLIFNPARTEFYNPERTSGATELRGNVTFARQGVANATILTFVASEHVASFSMDGLAWRNNFDRANSDRAIGDAE